MHVQISICAHLHLNRANKACFFMSVVKIWSALLNFFLMGISSSLKPVSSLIFILSKRVIFFLNTCPPPQYFTALSSNSCLISRSMGLTSVSGHWKSYPICFSHLYTVLCTEFFSVYFGGVRQLYSSDLCLFYLLRLRSDLWILMTSIF